MTISGWDQDTRPTAFLTGYCRISNAFRERMGTHQSRVA
jgi:hypothetical protein